MLIAHEAVEHASNGLVGVGIVVLVVDVALHAGNAIALYYFLKERLFKKNKNVKLPSCNCKKN